MTWKFAVILGTVQRNLRQKPAFSEEIRESHFNFSEWSIVTFSFELTLPPKLLFIMRHYASENPLQKKAC